MRIACPRCGLIHVFRVNRNPSPDNEYHNCEGCRTEIISERHTTFEYILLRTEQPETNDEDE